MTPRPPSFIASTYGPSGAFLLWGRLSVNRALPGSHCLLPLVARAAMVRARCFRTTSRCAPLHPGFTIPNAACWRVFSACFGRCWPVAGATTDRAGRARTIEEVSAAPEPEAPEVHPGRALRPLYPRRTRTHGSAARPAVADHRCRHARGRPRHGRGRAAACTQTQRLRTLPDRACRDRTVRAAAAGGALAPRPHDPARCTAHPGWPGLGTAFG